MRSFLDLARVSLGSARLRAGRVLAAALVSAVAMLVVPDTGPRGTASAVMASGEAGRVVTSGAYVPTNDWADRLGSDDYWRSRRSGEGAQSTGGWSAPKRAFAPPAGLTRAPRAPEDDAGGARGKGRSSASSESTNKPATAKKAAAKTDDDDDESPWTKEESRGTYRTLCVRMCDGYYWPISFSTSKGNLTRDAKVCERSCGVPAKLFFHENPGQQPEEMEDLKGKRYSSLKIAFQHRQQYDAACTCKPQPWDEAALARHQRFAELADRKKGGKAPPPKTIAQAPTSSADREQAVAPVVQEREPVLIVQTVASPDDVLRPVLPVRLQVLSASRRQSLAPHRLMAVAKAAKRPREVAAVYQSQLPAERRSKQSSVPPMGLGGPATASTAAEARPSATRPVGIEAAGQRPARAASAPPTKSAAPPREPTRRLADGAESQVR